MHRCDGEVGAEDGVADGFMTAAGFMAIGNSSSEEQEIERLCKAVTESVWTISAVTALSEREIFSVLAKLHVEKAAEIHRAVLALEDAHSIQRVGKNKLGIVIEEVISVIARGVGLDADELTEVLTEKRQGNVEDLIYWLHYYWGRSNTVSAAAQGDDTDAGNG